ncbi:MAG: hypothetical protein EBZ74_12670, partial [Planctomycetia bacterium]|nr:hypothetical protein [Planctomycetia bacterium]
MLAVASPTPTQRFVRMLRAAVFVAACAFALPSAHAQVTWSGSSGLWNASNAWLSTLSTTGTFNSALVFTGTTFTSSTNNYSTGTATSITFDSAASAFTLSGSTFTLTGNVTNSSSNLQSIANNIALVGNSTVTGTSVTLS